MVMSANAVNVIAVLLVVLGAALHRFLVDVGVRPEPLSAPAEHFSEARGRVYLDGIASLGVRTVGSVANEVEAPAAVLKAVEEIAERARKEKGTPAFELETDVQICNGEFLMYKQNRTNALSYQQLKNVVVRVGWGERTSGRSAVLVSSHYDSVPSVVGAADAGYCIATMLELLRAFIAAGGTGERDIDLIFNFNGAEEVGLNAAHGFITKHKWAKDVRAFVNCEAMGSGGRELAFQTTDAWLMRVYGAAVPRPHATSFAQEVFDSGVVSSDTDYRIYRDFGIPQPAGIDTALVMNGHVYHTPNDNVARLPPGTMQHTGDNYLRLIPALAHAVRERARAGLPMSEPDNGEQVIYFDVLGFFLIIFSAHIAPLMYCIVLGIALLICVVDVFANHASIVGLLGATLRQLASSVAAIVIATGAGALVSKMRPMMWYASDTIAIGMYGTAALGGMLLVHELWYRRRVDAMSDGDSKTKKKKTATKKGSSAAEAHAAQAGESLSRIDDAAMLAAFWSLPLQFLPAAAYLIFIEARSTFVVVGMFVFPGLARIGVAFLRMSTLSQTLKTTAATYMMAMSFIPGIVVAFAPTVFVTHIFLAIIGRGSARAVSELFCGAAVALCVVNIVQPFIFVAYTIGDGQKRRRLMTNLRRILTLIFIGTTLAAYFWNPYSVYRSKRVMIQHVHRCVLGSPGACESGLWVTTPDAIPMNAMLGFDGIQGVAKLEELFAAPPPRIADNALYGDLPYMKRSKHRSGIGTFLPTPQNPPSFAFPASVAVIEQTYIGGTDDDELPRRRRISLRATGGPSMHLIFNATSVVGWSVSSPLPPVGEGIHYLGHACGNHSSPCIIELSVDVDGDETLHMNLISHEYQHSSSLLHSYVAELPEWLGQGTQSFVSSLSQYAITPPP